MLTFKEFLLHERKRLISPKESHRHEIHDIIKSSYKRIGGYRGLGHGSEEESKAIHADISHPDHTIRAVKHKGKLVSAVIYRQHHGRKVIAAGTDGSPHGKIGLRRSLSIDHKRKRAWGEFSGAAEKLVKKTGMPKITATTAAKHISSPITPSHDDPHSYTREISGTHMSKTAYGHPR